MNLGCEVLQFAFTDVRFRCEVSILNVRFRSFAFTDVRSEMVNSVISYLECDELKPHMGRLKPHMDDLKAHI